VKGSNRNVTKTDNELASATLSKVSHHLIPFLFVLYIVAWLDRVNVGFAALQMNDDLHFSSATFGAGSGVFFLGYCLFEVPSNLVLERVGARLWIARIMITWGIISVGLMLVQTPTAFYLLRFLLGAAEAGFFPGMIYYLSLWYPVAQRARAIAAFMTAVPVSGFVGGALSGLLLGLDGTCGLRGWQWLFLLEGLPAILFGFSVLFVLNDGPETAGWLTPVEREWLVAKLNAEREDRQAARVMDIRLVLTNPVVWRLGVIFLFVAAGFYGYSFGAPLVVQSLLGLGNVGVGLVLAGVSLITVVAMQLNGAHSDRTGERPLHVALPCLVMGIGFIGCALLRQPLLALAALALVPAGHCASYGPFWSMPTQFLNGRAAAAGIAMVTMIANVGGFFGPSLIGVLKARTGTYRESFLCLAIFAIMAAVIAFRTKPAMVARGNGPS
jgi:ACS family tartrate transporter-like MFS transporter